MHIQKSLRRYPVPLNSYCGDLLRLASETRQGNERYGNGLSEHPTAENYTHTFQHHEQEAAEKLGQLFGTVWPEIDKEKLISFPNLSLAE